MKIRVGRIPYLNSEPFYYGMARDDIDLIQLVPSRLSMAAEAGEIDAGPVPLVDYFRLEDRFTQLGQFCISTLQKSRSILLYSKKPIQKLEGATIGITSETSTSRRLLQVLLAQRFEVEPAGYVTLKDPNDAFLIIGDEALRRRYGVPGYPYRYDLGEEWYRWTRMPFVYALWVVRKGMAPKQMTYLENVLYTCVDEGLEHVSTIGQMREDVRMSAKEIIEYYHGFRYWAGVGEIKAIRKFREYLDSLNTASAP
jgi:chorismate dehydratase